MIVSWVPLVMGGQEKKALNNLPCVQQTVHSQDPFDGYFNRMWQALSSKRFYSLPGSIFLFIL